MILLLSNLVVILSAILVFLAVVSILVGVLLFAKKKLTPQGEVTLTINDDKEIVVEPGSTILQPLVTMACFYHRPVVAAVHAECVNAKFLRVAALFWPPRSTSLRAVSKPKTGV